MTHRVVQGSSTLANSTYFKNTFTYGMIGKEMRRSVNAEIYGASASLIQNAVPLTTGGLSIRPGLKNLRTFEDKAYVRIIPFCIDEDEHYILALGGGAMDVIPINSGGQSIGEINKFSTTIAYTDSEILDICYAQDYEKLIFTHKNHAPLVIQKKGSGWSIANIVLDTITADGETSTDDNGVTIGTYSYGGLFTTTGNYPAGCAFIAGRLWMWASKNSPYTLWASRPFEYNNFQTTEKYEYVDEEVTVEKYLQAINGSGEGSVTYTDDEEVEWTLSAGTTNKYYASDKTTELSESESSSKVIYRRTFVVSISTSGYVQVVDYWYQKVYNDEDSTTWSWSLIESREWADYYNEVTTKWQEQVTADCALELEVGSDRNDTICWVRQQDYIYVGTTSSEYKMSSDITATDASISKIASYGSSGKIPAITGNNFVFYVQSGGKSIRSVTYGYYGHEYASISKNCKELFEDGIEELLWQRCPEPRLYARLSSGDIAVMCDDGTGAINAWCNWTFEGGTVLSLCILDTTNGQDVYALVSRDEGLSLEVFNEGLFTDGDGEEAIDVDVVTNLIDSSSTAKMIKSVVDYGVDSLGTKFKAGQYGVTLSTPPSTDDEMVMFTAYTKPRRAMQVELKNVPGEDFHILCVAAEVEIA